MVAMQTSSTLSLCRRPRSRVAAGIGSVLAALSFSSVAKSVTLTSVERTVFARAGVSGYPTVTDEDGSSTAGHLETTVSAAQSGQNAGCQYFCFTSEANASAAQTSDLTVLADSLELTGRLSASTRTVSGSMLLTGPPATATAYSEIVVAFAAEDSAQYAFEFEQVSYGSYDALYVTLQNLDTSAWALYGGQYPFTGFLAAGPYELRVWTDRGIFDVSFALTPVPEAGSFALVFYGLALTGALARRRLRVSRAVGALSELAIPSTRS